MKLSKRDKQMIGFVLIVGGILSIVSSPVLFQMNYTTASDILTWIGLPSLVVGTIVYAKVEEFI